MNKRYYQLVLLGTFLLSGCASGSYLRSEYFINPEQIRSLYVMPIIYEITVDPEYRISLEKMKTQIHDNSTQLKIILKQEFERRGYSLESHPRDYSDLEKDHRGDQAFKQIMETFVRNSTDQVNVYTAEEAGNKLGEWLSSIKKGFREEEQKARIQGEPQDISGKKKEGTRVGKFFRKIFRLSSAGGESIPVSQPAVQEQETIKDPLVKQAVASKTFFPKDSDAILLLKFNSLIAKRNLFGGLSERSHLNIHMQIISLSHRKSVVFDEVMEENADILSLKKSRQVLNGLIKKIPVKLGKDSPK